MGRNANVHGEWQAEEGQKMKSLKAELGDAADAGPIDGNSTCLPISSIAHSVTHCIIHYSVNQLVQIAEADVHADRS